MTGTDGPRDGDQFPRDATSFALEGGDRPDLGDSDAPLPGIASGQQFDRDATDLTGDVTEHAASPESWRREREGRAEREAEREADRT